MRPYLISDSTQVKGRPIGGKAMNLFRMKDLGVTVPRFMVLPADALFDASAINGSLQAVFPPDPELRFAVRSSGLTEDGAEHSFAGQFETFLFVPMEEVPDKVAAVRASAASDRVRAYRDELGLTPEQHIGVIIQEMVAADRSGVAFGSHPSSGDPRVKVVSAVLGLGEGIVSGELDADTWFVRPDGIEARIVKKERQVVRDADGSGTMIAEVSPSLQKVPVLASAQLAVITDALNKLNHALGAPQDIEFAFVGSAFYLLQTRPITAMPKGEYTVWDNSNIVESYPGVTTYLTFSFIQKMYEAVYTQFCDLLGVDAATIARNKHVFANTLGLVRGRVYYNLLHWYKMLAMVPGYRINARFMETMMGVKERFELSEEQRMTKATAWWRIAKMIFRMTRLQRRLPKERARFQRHLNATMERYSAIDFAALPGEEIIEHYREFERTLLKEWKAPLINDFFAMIAFGMLQKLCTRWVPGMPNLHNDLLCGSRDIISTEPIHACMSIARTISDNADAKLLFTTQAPETIWKTLTEGAHPIVKQAIDAYLLRFGERCVGELKLETMSYAQDPARLIAVLRGYVEKGITRSVERAETDEAVRLRAEDAAHVALRGKPMERWILRKVLTRTRELVSARENLRFERTRGFGMVRRIFTALGERWAADGTIEDPRDIFHLRLEEVLETQGVERLASFIAERKQQHAWWSSLPPPSERFATFGDDFSDDSIIYSKEKLTPIEGDLKGIGCCAGIVEARIRKVTDPSTISTLEGDILVTTSTDPGWVTLFPTCSAILVERGSLLSHSAIVSREMGIPCIVSIPGLMRTLHTGDRVRMDGSKGIIQVIDMHGRASA
jgi:rifampicin phosphotransferase